jgi:hypothetical protein
MMAVTFPNTTACIKAVRDSMKIGTIDGVDVLTPDQHDTDAEDFLAGGVGADVAEAHAGQARAGEVEGCDVGVGFRDVGHVGELEPLGQGVDPALTKKIQA